MTSANYGIDFKVSDTSFLLNYFWTHFDTNLPIEWEYYPGSSVSIVLYKASLPVYLLASSIANDGSWIYPGPLPMSFEPGDNYRIYIVDDMEYSCFSQYSYIRPVDACRSEYCYVIKVDACF